MPGQGFLAQFIGRLRFPQLFTVAAILLVLDLLIPDAIPFVDEALLALLTAMLSMVRRRDPRDPRDPRAPDVDADPPERRERNVTPR